MTVKELMETDVITLRSDDTLDIAEDIMSMGRIRHLPVVDINQRLLGLVTQRDLFKASLSSILRATPGREHQWLEKIRVREVMTKSVTTIGPEADLSEAVEKLLNGRFGCLPVVEKGKLVGIITETDFLRYVQILLTEKKRPRSSKSAETP